MSDADLKREIEQSRMRYDMTRAAKWLKQLAVLAEAAAVHGPSVTWEEVAAAIQRAHDGIELLASEVAATKRRVGFVANETEPT